MTRCQMPWLSVVRREVSWGGQEALAAVDLPEPRRYAGPLAVAREGGEFLAGISAGLADSSEELRDRRRRIARENTMDSRYGIIRDRVLGGPMSHPAVQGMPESR